MEFSRTALTTGALVALFLLAGFQAEGQTNQGLEDDAVPDISGIWVSAPGRHHGRSAFLSMELPFSDAGRAAWQDYVQDTDPAMGCSIDYGRVTGTSFFPMEILQGEDVVHILFEYDHQLRRVYIDGVNQPPGHPPSRMGLSVGRWEGDTLVVEVTSLMAGYFYERGFGPYSDDTQVTERFSISEDGQLLTVTRTINDPAFFTRPFDWTTRYMPGEYIYPYECEVRDFLPAPE